VVDATDSLFATGVGEFGRESALVLGTPTIGQGPSCGVAESGVGRPSVRLGVAQEVFRLGGVEIEPVSDRDGVGEPEDADGMQGQQVGRRVVDHELASCRAVNRVWCCWHACGDLNPIACAIRVHVSPALRAVNSRPASSPSTSARAAGSRVSACRRSSGSSSLERQRASCARSTADGGTRAGRHGRGATASAASSVSHLLLHDRPEVGLDEVKRDRPVTCGRHRWAGSPRPLRWPGASRAKPRFCFRHFREPVEGCLQPL
jgi:hypothetical protein